MTQVDDTTTGLDTHRPLSETEREQVQRRTVRSLLVSQVCGGMGLVSGYSVVALLADDITGNETLAGLAAASLSIGAAIASFPLARLMARSGRRPGLRTGYLIGAVGAFLAVLAAITRVFVLLPIGVMGIGAGSAANLAARYAAADLAKPERRAPAIGTIVWATTLGSGFGSLISLSVLDPTGQKLGLPDYGGSFLAGSLLFLIGDLCMPGFGAASGISAGAIVASRSYHDLSMAAAALGVLLVAAVVTTWMGDRDSEPLLLATA